MSNSWTGTDWAKIGLPLQILGFIALVAALFWREWWLSGTGLAMHIVGDSFFFFQMKKQGCL